MTIHMQKVKVKVKDHSVQKLEWKRTDRRMDKGDCSGVNLVHSLGGGERKVFLPPPPPQIKKFGGTARNSLFLGTKQLNIE